MVRIKTWEELVVEAFKFRKQKEEGEIIILAQNNMKSAADKSLRDLESRLDKTKAEITYNRWSTKERAYDTWEERIKFMVNNRENYIKQLEDQSRKVLDEHGSKFGYLYGFKMRSTLNSFPFRARTRYCIGQYSISQLVSDLMLVPEDNNHNPELTEAERGYKLIFRNGGRFNIDWNSENKFNIIISCPQGEFIYRGDLGDIVYQILGPLAKVNQIKRGLDRCTSLALEFLVKSPELKKCLGDDTLHYSYNVESFENVHDPVYRGPEEEATRIKVGRTEKGPINDNGRVSEGEIMKELILDELIVNPRYPGVIQKLLDTGIWMYSSRSSGIVHESRRHSGN